MAAPHHQWPMPPVKEQALIVRRETAVAPTTELPPAEREQLRQALEHMEPMLTGRLVWDPAAHMYVPELKPKK